MVTDQWVFWTEEENDRYKLPFSLQPSLTPKRGGSLIVSNRKQKLGLFKSFTASLSTFTKARKNESMKYPWKRIYNITGDLLQVNQACEGPIRKVGTYSSLSSTVKLLPTNLHLTQCIMLMSNCTVTCWLSDRTWKYSWTKTRGTFYQKKNYCNHLIYYTWTQMFHS